MINDNFKKESIIMKCFFVDQIIELMKLIDEIHSIFDLDHENLECKELWRGL